MKRVFIIHGSNGSSDKHWYPWLRDQLSEKGFKVTVPQFPIGDEQTLDNWLSTVESYRTDMINSILVGHSLGVPFIINLLNIWKLKINAAFLVSGFYGHLGVVGENNLEDFSEREINWDKVKNNCDQFIVVHSDDDPYVPLERGKELAKLLNAEMILVPGGKHFQKESGFEAFPKLLSLIERI